MKRYLVLSLLAGALMPCTALAQEKASTVGEIVVVAPSGAASGMDAAKLGSNVETLKAEAFQSSSALSITEALQRRAPGVNVSDTQGNPFTGDVNFRGFGASALQGAPQGLAVYMNGQRLNEAFGDTLSWDLIPQVAISRADVFTNNPIYGLNALGGAISLHMKDGFDSQGLRGSAEGGQFGSKSGSVEAGWTNGNWGLYLGVDGGQDDGWRTISNAKVERGFGDIGFKSERTELHLTASAAHSALGVVGPTPVDLIEADRTSVYTNPQATNNRARLLAASGSFALTDTLTVEAGAHVRRYDQSHLDGNDGSFEQCSANATNALFNTLCLQDDDFPAALRPAKAQFQITDLNGLAIACPPPTSAACNTTAYGTLDHTKIRSTTKGASLQLVSRAALFGRPNNLILGASLDNGDIRFSAASQLAVITPDLLVTTASSIPGAGKTIRAGTQVGYGPADIAASNRQTGLYFNDTLDVTDRLFVTLGGRLNVANVDTTDLTGRSPDLTTDNRFQRFNPAISAAFKVNDNLTLFGGFSENNRAPTPLELGCSDQLKPCLLENSIVSDPPLKQVLSRTYEAGLRGKATLSAGRITWDASLYQTENRDDIVSLASTLAGRGYYANVPGTRRRGIDLSIDYQAATWSAYASYSYVRAEYRFDGLLASSNNPAADANGDIAITSGDRLGGIPPQRFKVGGDWRVADRFSLGLDEAGVSAQYYVGDESNQNSKLAAYWVTNLRAEYELADQATLFARVDNVLGRDYETFGTYFDPSGVALVTPNPLPVDPDPRTVTPAAPRKVSVGLRVKF